VVGDDALPTVGEGRAEALTTRVLRPYGWLPPRGAWDVTPREPYVDALPDTLAGLLRQFTAAMLDLGRLVVADPHRYAVYRKQVFDTRDRLMALLSDWLAFWGVTDADGRVRDAVRAALVGAVGNAGHAGHAGHIEHADNDGRREGRR
jgi:hypothetical protein